MALILRAFDLLWISKYALWRPSIGSLNGEGVSFFFFNHSFSCTLCVWLKHVWIGKKKRYISNSTSIFQWRLWHLLALTLSKKIKHVDLAQIMWRWSKHWNNVYLINFFDFSNKWSYFILLAISFSNAQLLPLVFHKNNKLNINHRLKMCVTANT